MLSFLLLCVTPDKTPQELWEVQSAFQLLSVRDSCAKQYLGKELWSGASELQPLLSFLLQAPYNAEKPQMVLKEASLAENRCVKKLSIKSLI